MTVITVCVLYVSFLVSMVRLAGGSMGYIEIEDDSTWKKVDEKNWDKDRQKLLCQYFEFEEAATIEKRNIDDAQKIATGDLICYKTQPNRTSCCAHLQPSLSLKSTIPYVQCKYRSTNRIEGIN